MAQLTSTTISGNLSVIGNTIASKIIKLGGTSSQILMADGSARLISELFTDTGATSITTSGSGNAVTSGSYNATTRQITLNKGTTFVTGASSSNMTVSTSGGVITITHPTTTATTAGLYKIGKDSLGHVVIGDTITPGDLGLSTVYNYRGTKTWAQLKALTSAEIGDVYSITDKDPDGNTNADWACYKKVTAATGDSYATYWQSLGGKVDLSAYVQGPSSATDNAIARFNSTTGKIIKNSTVTIDDSGNVKAKKFVTDGSSNQYVVLGDGTTKALSDFAMDSEIPNPEDYYWANVKVSTTSNDATVPTFSPTFKYKIAAHNQLKPDTDWVISTPIAKYL